MATVNYVTREVELAVQEEATYGTSPGAPVGGDFFKHKSRLHITPVIGRYDRDQEADYQNASVSETAKTREHSTIKIEADVVPSGNATTPTEPDIDLLIKHHLGQKHKATAHTTTAAGSVGTAINFTTGGVAASGVAVGDIIAIDVDGAGGYEARSVEALPGGDVVTVCRAFTSDPPAGRAVKVGTTYRPLNTYAMSLYLSQWIAGNGIRHAVPGLILPDMTIKVTYATESPVLGIDFSGEGKAEITHAVSRPTPATAGSPLVPSQGRVWLGAVKACMVNAELKSNNGYQLRKNESCSLQPTGLKRTANNSRFMIDQTLDALLSTGDIDTAAIYDSAKALGGIDVLAQHGITPGAILVWRTRKFIPNPERGEQDGEFSLKLAGRCYATVGTPDTEVQVAFL